MGLRVFPVAGAALNFGARRMETIMRLAWLPIALLLVFDMVFVFGVLSIARDELITFGDIAGRASFRQAAAAAQQTFPQGLAAGDPRMLAVGGAFALVNAILVASFMAPLIRLAGLGERPAGGIVRLPFGADQVRYLAAQAASLLALVAIVALPAWASLRFILGRVDAALTQVYAAFPDENSLHTVEIVGARDVLAERGGLWFYEYGAWVIAGGAAFAFLLALSLVHFHPRNRPYAEKSRPPLRAMALFVVLGLGVFAYVSSATNGLADGFFSRQSAAAALSAILALLVCYLSLRLMPYAGVAVCGRSMALGGTLKVTRGWNLLRLAGALVVIFGLIVAVQFFIEGIVFFWLSQAIVSLFAASDVYARLLNSGEAPGWILPAFIWMWAGLQILYRVFWLFFTYGVWAGLLGVLYRASTAPGR